MLSLWNNQIAVIDLRLSIPRWTAALIALLCIWYYSRSVSTLIHSEQIEGELQDIRIPAGTKNWIVVSTAAASGQGAEACRGTISSDLRTVERTTQTADSVPPDGSAASPLPLKKITPVVKHSIFSLNGQIVVDLLGHPFPASFNSAFEFNEEYQLADVAGSLDARTVKVNLQTLSKMPLIVAAEVALNGASSASTFTAEAPIFLILDRTGAGTLKLPADLRSGLRGLLPKNFSSQAASAARLFQLKEASPPELSACSSELARQSAAAGGGKNPAAGSGASAVLNLKMLPLPNTPAQTDPQ